MNVTPAPNLDIVLEGPSSNNSLLEINDSIFMNGTVLSRGLNPAPMEGTLPPKCVLMVQEPLILTSLLGL